MGKHEAGDGSGAFFRVFYNEELYVLKNETAAPDTKTKNEEKAEPSPEPAVVKAEAPVIALCGNNNAQTLVLFNNSDGLALPEAELTLVQRILAAVKLNWDDVAWFNTAGKSFPGGWADLERAGHAVNILAFGLQPELLPEGIANGEPVLINNKWVLSVENLGIIGQSQEKKKILWDALQKIYRP